LWSLGHEPAENTLEIVKTLESVLARDPDHPGAREWRHSELELNIEQF